MTATYDYKDYMALVESLDPFCIFAFGSLMWAPDFDYEAKTMARVDGYHRRFGLWSKHWRGTADQPGLVLGLDEGGQTVGVGFLVADKNRAAVANKLWEREMISYAYLPRALPIVPLSAAHSQNGGYDSGASNGFSHPNIKAPLKALAFTLDPRHEQYVSAGMGLAEQARIIATAKGLGGPNRDYFLSLIQSFAEMKIEDDHMAALHQELQKLTAKESIGAS